MNPPSALYGAMNKDRKPFTYTPGGLDLSEIKSERMAQRLMRNAMSQGVPEAPLQNIHSPPVQSSSGAIPNFNCLPVQVFPSFPLPANPKSLLRNRSNPEPSKESFVSVTPSSLLYLSDEKSKDNTKKHIETPAANFLKSNNIIDYTPVPKYDYRTESIEEALFPSKNYRNEDNIDKFLPKTSYDAEYFILEPEKNIKLTDYKNDNIEDVTTSSGQILYPYMKIYNESNPVVLTSSSPQDRTANDFEQKEIKTVKKQSKTEKQENQNGDTDAAVVVKLPAKKSAAKTETNVEVVKKSLPDGTIQEVKTTTTKTTIDGKTEIRTETETSILPKEETEETVEIEEEEEEEEEIETDVVETNENEESNIKESSRIVKESSENGETVPDEDEEEYEVETENTNPKENGIIITNDEKTETTTTTTKKVSVIQSPEQDSGEEEEEEIVEEEEEEEEGDVNVEQVIVLQKHEDDDTKKESDDTVETKKAEEEIKSEDNEDDEKDDASETLEEDQEKQKDDITQDDVEETDQTKNDEVEGEEIENEEPVKETKEEYADEEFEEAEDVPLLKNEVKEENTEPEENQDSKEQEQISELSEKESQSQVTFKEPDILKEEINKPKEEHTHKITFQSEPKLSFREPSIPLEKVEDVEIKPIAPAQEVIKKCHTEIITTTKDEPTGALSTQTEYNRIENIVTVNRTTKTLDHAYEQAEHTIPTVKTYFVPQNDRILSTPQPISRPYQPIYTPEPQTERRHSLLLDRLSVERQIPVQQSDIYQNTYSTQTYDQNQWMQEPQSEVLTVSNVKPSTITKNQQWYQQTKKETTPTPNIISPTPIMPSQLWSQAQTQAQTQPQPQPQPQYQSYTPNVPKVDYQPTYLENNNQISYKNSTTNIEQNVYPSYTPKPSWVGGPLDAKPAPITPSNQYSTLKRDTTESYQKSTQQLSSSYVPPPWEQDSSYIVDNQNYYQPPPTIVYTPANQTWKPKPTSKFSKPAPTAYIPPAPNQSFVKTVTNIDPPKLPGRKTYYSEYERRYISVPESTYIPNETKYQAQPDPSPQFYFDNNEPAEIVEPQWRKELREFTEKTSQTTVQTEKTSVRPPWEEDSKYTVPEYTATVTPTWTQTLRPRSWRERSFEPEYIGSKEWPKTNTLGRGRPQSSYVKSNVDTIPERPRGVSVDRYNPNSYQSPPTSEHPPVQTYTLNPTVYPKTYHNPSVPAYHSRASAEPREHPTPYAQPRSRVDPRVPPVQSRSFKYLQWITGTED